MPLRIGLTGGIASGKSLAAARFAELGAPVIDSDQLAREVVAPGTALAEQLLRVFGPAAAERYGQPLAGPDGAIDRALLRRLVFDVPDLRRQLEGLLHPAIRALADRRAREAPGPYQVHVIPLLVETGAAERFERVLVIDCPESVQRARLAARDGAQPALIEAMLAAQCSRIERLRAAHDVLANTGTAAELSAAVDVLHQRYCAMAMGVYAHGQPQAQ